MKDKRAWTTRYEVVGGKVGYGAFPRLTLLERLRDAWLDLRGKRRVRGRR